MTRKLMKIQDHSLVYEAKVSTFGNKTLLCNSIAQTPTQQPFHLKKIYSKKLNRYSDPIHKCCCIGY